jgi:hypothetical protein
MRLQAVKVAAAASLLGVIDAREVYGRQTSSVAARQLDDPTTTVKSYQDCPDHCNQLGFPVSIVTIAQGS